ncbi:MAG: hypothetical protein V4585_07095 [Bacteroidota bacterium]
MKNRSKVIFVIIGLIIFWLGIILVKYYGSYWYDLYQSPWAYSQNTNEKLLVGKWKGDFTDPDGVKKYLDLTIIEPTTNEERWEKAFTFKKRRRGISRNLNNIFDGTASVKSRLGVEEYTVSGHVIEDNYHQFSLHFSPVDEKKRILPNFTLFDSTPSSWQNDEMNATLKFAYHKADGSSFWKSSDPKYSAKIACKLNKLL